MERKWFTPARIFLLCMTAVFLALGVVGYCCDQQTSETSASLIEKHTSGVGQITDIAASQTFTATENNLSVVSVMFSNYAKKVKSGTLTLTLTDAQGTVVGEDTQEAADMRNNAFVSLSLAAPLADSKGKVYTLSVTSTCTEGKGVTVRMGEKTTEDAAAVLTLPDGTTDAANAMNLRLTYRETVAGRMPAFTCLLIALCFACALPFGGRKESYRA